jgi:hypothetical protein
VSLEAWVSFDIVSDQLGQVVLAKHRAIGEQPSYALWLEGGTLRGGMDRAAHSVPDDVGFIHKDQHSQGSHRIRMLLALSVAL